MFQLPTGGGKTFLFSAIAKDLLQERILVLVHREELIYQAQESLETACGVRVGIIKSGVAPEPLCMIQVASVQTLIRRSLPPAGLVIVDECFPAGTLVDGKPIESYQVGDYVTSFDENTGAIAKKRVTRLFKNPLKELVKVSLSNGDEIICTPEHPVLTPIGWICAKNLNLRDFVHCGNTRQWIEIAEVEDYSDYRGGYVYNLEVEDWHTYLVDGDRGSYVVHNCHHATADSYRKILDGYPDAYILGVTATPCRTDGSGFDDLFDSLVSVIGVKDLIAQGSLCKYKLFADPNPIKTKGIRTTAGDYNQKELAQSVNTSILSANLVQTYRDRCPDKRCVVFAINVEHSMAIAERYKQAGIPAEHLDGDTETRDRKAILERFRTGETLVVSNVGILTEGFNLPSIEAVQIARPTKSLSLWLQMVGRALRPSIGKEHALILDHTENWMKLGMPCAKHIWTLEGVEPEEKQPRFRKTKDNEVVEDGFFEIEEGDAELEEIREDDAKAIAIQLEIEQFNKLLEIAEHRQYKKAWAVYKFLEIEPSYEALLVCAGIMGYKPQWAAMKYKEYA